MDTREREVVASVAQYGWTAIGVDERRPSYVYSVGLAFSADHPEIIVCGLPQEGYLLLKLVVTLVAGGESFASPGIYTNILNDVPLAVRPVHPTQAPRTLEYASAECDRRGRPDLLQAIQIFWPDDAGRYPFDADCDPAVAELQPRLDLALIELTEHEMCR